MRQTVGYEPDNIRYLVEVARTCAKTTEKEKGDRRTFEMVGTSNPEYRILRPAQIILPHLLQASVSIRRRIEPGLLFVAVGGTTLATRSSPRRTAMRPIRWSSAVMSIILCSQAHAFWEPEGACLKRDLKGHWVSYQAEVLKNPHSGVCKFEIDKGNVEGKCDFS